MKISPLAGKLLPPAQLVNVPRLVTAYFTQTPDPAQRVAFGTSGHRGSAFDGTFNEAHILAISQAVCRHRRAAGVNGPLFIGIDTHALSRPALATALEVFAANGVDAFIDEHDGFTPTPVISHAILTYNRGRTAGLADGVVITPSHNPPEDGGFKYNTPDGGPADIDVTGDIQQSANALLTAGLDGIKRIPLGRALKSAQVHRHDYIGPYVEDLAHVVDMDIIRASGVRRLSPFVVPSFLPNLCPVTSTLTSRSPGRDIPGCAIGNQSSRVTALQRPLSAMWWTRRSGS